MNKNSVQLSKNEGKNSLKSIKINYFRSPQSFNGEDIGL